MHHQIAASPPLAGELQLAEDNTHRRANAELQLKIHYTGHHGHGGGQSGARRPRLRYRQVFQSASATFPGINSKGIRCASRAAWLPLPMLNDIRPPGRQRLDSVQGHPEGQEMPDTQHFVAEWWHRVCAINLVHTQC